MVRWMSATFYWLTEYYIKRIEFMDTLEEVGLECFREMAFRKIQANVTSIVLRLADECLRRRDTVTQYLRSTNEQCVVQMHQHELSQLLQNEHFGFTALLRDGKVEDLSTIFRLFLEIPLGRASFAVAFRQHVTAEGEALGQEVAQGTGSFQHADDTAKKQPSIKEMKKHIESLIVDQYLKREYLKGEPDALYHYQPRESFGVCFPGRLILVQIL